jgi:uncharacterized protein
VIVVQINLTNIFTNDLQFAKIEKTIIIKDIQFGNETAQVQDDVSINLELEKVANNEILVNGLVKTILILNCDRCNEPTKYHLEADFSKEVRIDKVVEDEEAFMEGYNLDLEKLALNEIFVNFPMKMLCKEDCMGICKTCGTNLNLASCNCENDNIDLRFAGLKALYDENFKEV